MRLRLPYPPLGNRAIRVVSGRAVKSRQSRAYQLAVRMRALTAGHRRPLEGPVVVSIAAYRPWRRGDLDGVLKVTLDALQGVAYVNDKQIVELHAARFDDPLDPRLMVTVEAAT